MKQSADPGNLIIEPYEGERITIKDYLKLLLRELWIKEAGFSGKRPFGNGGWKGPIEATLIKNELVDGLLDNNFYILQVNDEQVDKIIFKIIDEF